MFCIVMLTLHPVCFFCIKLSSLQINHAGSIHIQTLLTSLPIGAHVSNLHPHRENLPSTSERLVLLGMMKAQLRESFKPISTILP